MASLSSAGLKVLLMTDLVGSVSLQHRLGTDAYAALKAKHDALFLSAVEAAPTGEILEQTGDGFLIVFDNVRDALQTALAIQSRIKREKWRDRPAIRMGVHLGEVSPTTDPGTGHARFAGINVSLTARIMDLAGAGQILLSRPVYENAVNSVRHHPEDPGQPTPDLRWEHHGSYRFKGIDEEVQVYELGGVGIAPFKTPPGGSKARRASSIPRMAWGVAVAILGLVAAGVVFMARQSGVSAAEAPNNSSGAERANIATPTIAVLPFRNLEGDTHASFAAGMHDDILTSLAQVSQLRVLSRTSVVAFVDSRLTLPQIAAELGATHLVEGSVRRAGHRVRVVVQLIEARSDRNLWSETYDRELQDVFAIQSEIARKIASQLVERLSPAEVAELDRAPPTSNIAAYDAYNRARELWRQRGEDATEVIPEIVMELREALQLDPSFLEAGSLLESIYEDWAESEMDASPMQKGAARLAVNQLKRFGPALGRVLQSQLPEIETVFDLVSAAATQRAAGRFNEATTSLERAVAQEPGNRSLRMDLVKHLRTIGAWAQAKDQLEDWLAANPHDSAAGLECRLAQASLNPSDTHRAELRAWLEAHPPNPGELPPERLVALSTLLTEPAIGMPLSRSERANEGGNAAPSEVLPDARLLFAYWAGKDALAGAAALENLTRLEANAPDRVAAQPLAGLQWIMSRRLLGEAVDAYSIAETADAAWVATNDAYLRLERYPALLALWSYVDLERAVERYRTGPPNAEDLDLLPGLALYAPLMPDLFRDTRVQADLAERPQWQSLVESALSTFRPLP